jgi:hypothetical protein
MARARSHDNGNGKLNKLDDAISSLIQAQAQLIQIQATTQTQIAESARRQAEYEQLATDRFAKIERILLEHSRILAEHGRVLQALPDAVRQKIGFRPSEQA